MVAAVVLVAAVVVVEAVVEADCRIGAAGGQGGEARGTGGEGQHATAGEDGREIEAETTIVVLELVVAPVGCGGHALMLVGPAQ